MKNPKNKENALKRAIKYTQSTPAAISGNGGHNQTFKLASALVHGFALDASVAYSILLEHYNPECKPAWSPNELRHKIDQVIENPPEKPRGYLLLEKSTVPILSAEPLTNPLSVTPDDPYQAFLGHFRCTEEDLRNASAVNLDVPPHQQGALLISSLYNPCDLVNIVVSSQKDTGGKFIPSGKGETQKAEDWISILDSPFEESQSGWWMRMNPVDGFGVSDVNITEHRFCLLEMDNAPLDEQLSLFAKLPLPIAAIIYSGGRSYHAWVKIDSESEEEYQEVVGAIYDGLKPFGIDTSNRNPSRLSRSPGIFRGSSLQKLVYLNPQPAKEVIL